MLSVAVPKTRPASPHGHGRRRRRYLPQQQQQQQQQHPGGHVTREKAHPVAAWPARPRSVNEMSGTGARHVPAHPPAGPPVWSRRNRPRPVDGSSRHGVYNIGSYLVRIRGRCVPRVRFADRTIRAEAVGARGVRRILVSGVNAPLPPEAKKFLKI